MGTPAVVKLRNEDLARAAAALGAAFQDDPLMTWTLPDRDERARLAAAHFEPVLRYGLMFGEVWTTADRPLGAAVWLKPDDWEVTPERASASGLDRMGDLIGHAAADRFFSVMGALEPCHHRDVDSSHWYVMVVGLAPEARGKGLGRALLEPVMRRADAEGRPCYLETSNPTNVAFYERLGFRVITEMQDQTSGLRLWTFRREAR